MHSNTKPNKIWVDQFSEFYNNTFRDFLKINIIEMYSTYNERKSVVTERLIRTLKNKIFKHMAAISKKKLFWYIRWVTLRIYARDDYYPEYNENPNKKDPKFKVGDNVWILKYKNIFAKGYTPNWSEEVFIIKKIKNTVPWTYWINDLNGEEITGSFYENENCKKLVKKKFRI